MSSFFDVFILNRFRNAGKPVELSGKQSSLEASQIELFKNLKRDGKFTEGVTKSAGPGSSTVENKNFRDWRARFAHGGDFVVFSNVRWEGVPRPIIWTYPRE